MLTSLELEPIVYNSPPIPFKFIKLCRLSKTKPILNIHLRIAKLTEEITRMKTLLELKTDERKKLLVESCKLQVCKFKAEGAINYYHRGVSSKTPPTAILNTKTKKNRHSSVEDFVASMSEKDRLELISAIKGLPN